MIPAWRGIVDKDGDVWAWPTILMDHKTAFFAYPIDREMRARWRQGGPGDKVDFDPGASEEDKRKVEDWINAVSDG